MTTVGAQVERIAGNVSAALAAIEAKGVEVPEGSTSDNLAPLISAIPEGGGLSGDFLADEDFLLALGIDPFEPEPTIKYLYENLDYIQSTGEQWIDTGFTPNQDTKVVMDVQSVGEVSEAGPAQSFFGARAQSGQYFCAYWRRSDAAYYNFYGSAYATKSSERLTDRLTVTMDKGTLTVGDSISIVRSYESFTCPCTLYLFATNQAGTAVYQGVYRTWGCKVYDNGNLVRDFVPRRRKSDGAVGMLDLVSEVFYESASGVDFLAPGDLPAGYTQVEYIESNGSQYIDTGFKPNQNTRVVFAFYPVSTKNTFLFGCRSSSSGSDKFCSLHANDTNAIRDDYGSENLDTGITPSGLVVIDKNKGATTVNGEVFTHAGATFQSTLSMPLFAGNTGGTVGQNTSVQSPYCLIYDDGTLVHDYVPCVNASGIAGFYDVVAGEFKASATSTAFVAGPIAA